MTQELISEKYTVNLSNGTPYFLGNNYLNCVVSGVRWLVAVGFGDGCVCVTTAPSGGEEGYIGPHWLADKSWIFRSIGVHYNPQASHVRPIRRRHDVSMSVKFGQPLPRSSYGNSSLECDYIWSVSGCWQEE